METDGLVEELRDARGVFFRALDAIAPDSLTTPGLIGEWSGRDLIAHLGYWAGHATEVLHAVEQGRIDEVGVGEPPVDEVNATVARVSRTTELATVRRREAASAEALIERLALLDPAMLRERLPDGATVEEGIREDGAAHYREHAEELRRLLEERPRGDRDALLTDLVAARDAFHDVLAEVDAELATVPGVMDDWSVRDIVFHLAAWCEHASEVLALATAGRGDEFAYSAGDTDAMNERFLAEGRGVSPAQALRREEAAFAAFRAGVESLDPALLTLRLGNGDTVEEVIGYDGSGHYVEHSAHLSAWFGSEGDE